MPVGSNMQWKLYIARNHEKEINSFMESKNVLDIESGLLWHLTDITLNKNLTSLFFLGSVFLSVPVTAIAQVKN